MRLSKVNELLPPELGKGNTVLMCILKGNEKYNTHLKYRVEKLYHGRHVFLDHYELNADKYENKGEFRYVFDYIQKDTLVLDPAPPYKFSSGPRFVTVHEYFYHIDDRLTNKRFSNTFSRRFRYDLVWAYMILMERKRISNQ